MMIKNSKYILLALASVGFVACNTDDVISGTTITKPVVELTAGSANFSNYVALGNSLTAGYTDGALFAIGQENSLTNMLSKNFAEIGGGSFTQPLMSDNTGGLLFGTNQITENRLVFNGSGPARLETVIGPVTPTTNLTSNPTGPFNNMGVPGAKSFHLLAPGYGNAGGLLVEPATANPYFVRMTGTSPDASVLELAMAQSPTFFSLWIGNNDVLGYATTGGDGSNPITPAGGDIGVGFDASYGALIATLTAGGTQGVVANIPYVTSIPFFTTVPYAPLSPENPDFGPQIPTLNATFTGLNAAYDFLNMPERKIVFSATAASPVLIHDESLPNIAAQLAPVLQGGGLDAATAGLFASQFGQSRQATAEDLLILPSSAVIATLNTVRFAQLKMSGLDDATAGSLSVNGVTFPLEDKWVLLPSEQMEIKTAIDGYNATIKAAADQAGLAFVDVNATLQTLADTGIESNGYTLNSSLVFGGAFSLDGVHLTARGYAFTANLFLKAIDAKYGSNFEAAGKLNDVGDSPTNYSPLLQ